MTNNEKISKPEISTENGYHRNNSLFLAKENNKTNEKKWERESKIEEQCYKKYPNSGGFYN